MNLEQALVHMNAGGKIIISSYEHIYFAKSGNQVVVHSSHTDDIIDIYGTPVNYSNFYLDPYTDKYKPYIVQDKWVVFSKIPDYTFFKTKHGCLFFKTCGGKYLYESSAKDGTFFLEPRFIPDVACRVCNIKGEFDV